MRLSPGHLLLAALGALFVAAVGYVLFVLSDATGALRNTGPFSGLVIDASTKQPVRGAYVLSGWAGSTFIDGGGCVGGSIARTDDKGRFYIPWQGMNIKWFLHNGIARGALYVWAADYRPWTSQEDGRAADEAQAALPVGAPFVVKDVGTISLVSGHREDPEQSERRSPNCAQTRWFEETQEYIAYRSKWSRVCGQPDSGTVGTSADLDQLNKWISRLPLVQPNPSDTGQARSRSEPVDPQVLAAYKLRSANIDHVDLLIHAPHDSTSSLKTRDELTSSDWRQACSLLDFRIAGIQE